MTKKKEEGTRALFIQRFLAFLIDVFIVYLVVALISYPFINKEKTEEYSNQAMEMVEKLSNNDIDINDYVVQYQNLYYNMAQVNGISSFISIIVSILYFVVYQIYKNGQTIGKKIMKIRVVSLDGDLFMNQMIFRSMLANSIIFDLLIFVFLAIGIKSTFFYSAILIEAIQYIIFIISVFMVMIRKDGCAIHDILVHTKVVRED